MLNENDHAWFERFLRESNEIEGVSSVSLAEAARAMQIMLSDFVPTIPCLLNYGAALATNRRVALRERVNMDVRVGLFEPPRGGPEIRDMLQAILDKVDRGSITPFDAHHSFEVLHPFMDGNGRIGRLLWLWQMFRDREWRRPRSFLHEWYYQSLAEAVVA